METILPTYVYLWILMVILGWLIDYSFKHILEKRAAKPVWRSSLLTDGLDGCLKQELSTPQEVNIFTPKL